MLSLAAVPLMVGGFSVSASAADGINILDNVKLNAQIRPRYEYADVKDNKDAANKDIDAGQAFTARTKLNVSAGLLGVEGLTTNIGIISVNNFGWNDYNSGANGQTQYDKIGDPQKAMISNADINYKVGKTLFHAGRGQVNLDNQRFIGTVGWRQLERSYDSVFVADNSVKNLSLLAAWVYGLQGVNANPTADTNTVLLHASYSVMPELKVTAYDYMIANFADTYGIALTGNVKAAGAKISYRAEYAQQADPTMTIHDTLSDGTKTDDIKADASYYNLDLSANISGFIVGANYEFMSGDDDTTDATRKSFKTPLGTNHKFNGWADVYMGGRAGTGLIDMNAKLGYTAKGFGKALLVYHQFTADKAVNGKDDLGSEIDMLYANKIPGVNNLKGLIKGAMFSGGDIGQTKDVTKFWVMLDYKFATK